MCSNRHRQLKGDDIKERKWNIMFAAGVLRYIEDKIRKQKIRLML